MIRVWLVLALVAALVYIYSIVDCALADRTRVRTLPKSAWLPIVIVFAFIGGVLWFIIGRPRKGADGGRRDIAPDDNPEFLRHLGDELGHHKPGDDGH
jgi:hypothetical protein